MIPKILTKFQPIAVQSSIKFGHSMTRGPAHGTATVQIASARKRRSPINFGGRIVA
jgi:hypothetical protein